MADDAMHRSWVRSPVGLRTGFLAEPRLGSVILVVVLQNLFVFWNHYFRGFAFPWDFLGPYHAVPFYWMEAAKQGAGLQWIPFQGMGYPTYLNLQTSLYYPPLWLLVWLNQTYTLSTAVVMQALHVGFGGLGAAACARLAGMSWRSTLLAAVFYQGFGAFYTNSEHVDIVRAYALLPWLAASVLARWSPLSPALKALVLLQPLFVYSLWTGGYLGVAVAVMFVLGTTLLVRIAGSPQGREVGLLVAAALLAGCLLAVVFLLPAWLSVAEIARAVHYRANDYDYSVWQDVFALLYRIDKPVFVHDISMRSIFIGVPGVALLLLALPHMRRWCPWTSFAAVLSLAMATGLLHRQLIGIVLPLGYSRFPHGDYRAIFGLALILIAARSIEQPRARDGVVWMIGLFAVVLAGNYVLQLNQPAHAREVALVLVAVVLSVVCLWWIWRHLPAMLLPALVVVYLLDWSRVHWRQIYFNVPRQLARTDIERVIGPLEQARAKLVARLAAGDGCRPARTDVAATAWNEKPWRGYYTGEYMLRDATGPMQFRRQQRILGDDWLRGFALQPWRAVTVAADVAPAALAQAPVAGALRCARYGTDRVEYDVRADAAVLAVENEVFWKGWSARMVDAAGRHAGTLDPVEVHGFRGWQLPAGAYRLVAEYRTPNVGWAAAVSIAGLAAWLALGLVLLRHRLSALAR